MKVVSLLVVALGAGLATVVWLWSHGAVLALLCAPFAASFVTAAFAAFVALRPEQKSARQPLAPAYDRREMRRL